MVNISALTNGFTYLGWQEQFSIKKHKCILFEEVDKNLKAFYILNYYIFM